MVGHALFVYKSGELPVRISQLDLSTGHTQLWKTITPPDPGGVVGIGPVIVTPDGMSYVYSYHRMLGDLFVVEGLK